MSTAFAALPLPVRPEEDPGRRLRALERPHRRRRPKIVYALSALAGAALIGAAQIGLTLATTQDSFVLAELRVEQRELTLQAQAVQDQITGLSSPQYLAANADALGMVVEGTPAYLRLSDAAVMGASGGAGYLSTVNPGGSATVGNALVAETPLVTAPRTTIHGALPADPASPAASESTPEASPDLPPAITEGLPSPKTH